MESMIFKVSAKTARLIGRENISDVDGAIIELIKNAYDADAECVFVKYINPYNEIPIFLTLSEIKLYFTNNMRLINNYYEIKDRNYYLKKNLNSYDELENFIKSLSSILIIDNGTGMSKEILQNSWMNIGTSNKEINIYSEKKNRIKTGAKGIGRFALDKLSLKTEVYTCSNNDYCYKWNIDWQQFENADYLNEVKASLNINLKNFKDIVKEKVGNDFELIDKYEWETGTLIQLSPIRDFWNERLYKKVNDNLKNINPLGSVDKFEVIIKNQYLPQYNFEAKNEIISRDNYDYAIEASYDGVNTVNIDLDRNEIDIDSNTITLKNSETYSLDEFWQRDAFKKNKYSRNDFNGIQNFSYNLSEILPAIKNFNKDCFKRVGAFSLKMYYLKNTKSTVEIVKKIKIKERKELLSNFYGIKIYRDNFKIRLYGDNSQFYDWLDLSGRVQRNPAAASHESGKWCVSPNQLIGSVSIGRLKNPYLTDNANREGMLINAEYESFVNIIQGIISKFELDRQYVLREFAKWIKSKSKNDSNKPLRIYNDINKERQQKNSKEASNKINKESFHNNKNEAYTEEELKDAILYFGKEKEADFSKEKLMMVLSAAGVMAQTFSHEITRIGTELGSRGQHLKVAIDRLLNNKPYVGDEDFNPYDMIKELNGTDTLLAEWVNLIMNSIDRNKFRIKRINIKDFLLHIKKIWSPLLGKKYIKINQIQCSEEINLSLPEIDLHLLVNNFILNSSYFLEEKEGIKTIDFSVKEEKNWIILEMKNNGPRLHEKYQQNPDETLLPLETTKPNGTGLGLWIASEATSRNDGELHVIDIPNGYMLKALWKK